MLQIAELKPSGIWGFFAEILQIPRPSKHEEKIISFLEKFASDNSLEIKKDKVGNLLIKKPASKGFESIQPVVLQSHIDMVCEKNSDVTHNFETDAINAYIDGDWVKAKGTTLGADNGIGIAAQLAVLADKSLVHGPIECLFTVDEETGLTGAKLLESGFFDSKVLINLDSEDEGEIFIGCAGGMTSYIHYPLKKTKAPQFATYKVSLTGLKGGHSGDDINKGLANSNKLLIRFLWNCSKNFDIKLSDFQGGNLHNAIPREAYATILVKPKMVPTFKVYFDKYLETIKSEYSFTEPGLNMLLEIVDRSKRVLKQKNQDKLLCSLYACPNGVVSMSQAVPGLVETSTNLAAVHFSDNNTAEIVTSQRSSIESAKRDIANRIKSTFYLAKATVEQGEGYPGWTPNPESAILKVSEKVYESLFQTKAKIKAIHAGLECGLFLEKYTGLDMISIGPTLRGVHSPDERLQIETVDKFWKFLVKILEEIPKL